MAVTIRDGHAGDATVVAEFNRRLAEETEAKHLDPATVEAGVRAALADPSRARYFLAEQAGEVVGQLMVTGEWSDWRNGWMWWIQSVYVRQPARRQGVFRALYDHVLQTARQDSSVVGLRLYVEHDNTVAQETYRQLGMKRTGYHVLETEIR